MKNTGNQRQDTWENILKTQQQLNNSINRLHFSMELSSACLQESIDSLKELIIENFPIKHHDNHNNQSLHQPINIKLPSQPIQVTNHLNLTIAIKWKMSHTFKLFTQIHVQDHQKLTKEKIDKITAHFHQGVDNNIHVKKRIEVAQTLWRQQKFWNMNVLAMDSKCQDRWLKGGEQKYGYTKYQRLLLPTNYFQQDIAFPVPPWTSWLQSTVLDNIVSCYFFWLSNKVSYEHFLFILGFEIYVPPWSISIQS